MPTLKGIERRLEVIRGQFFVDLSLHHRDSVLLCAMQRSGSTWLGNVINYDNSFRFMYEPFHSGHVPQAGRFKTWQYLRPTDHSPDYLGPAAAIFDGRIRNSWISAYNKRTIARRRLIKDVRCLMMIGWIRSHFPEMPVILLLRHPCAILNSLLKLRWKDDTAAVIFAQPQLMEDHLEPFRADIEAASSDVDNHLLAWCANYYVALRQLAGRRVFVAFYERIISEPRGEVARLFQFLGRPLDDRVFNKMMLPSVQARIARFGDSSAVVSGGDLLDAWRKHVTREQVERALFYLNRFGLDWIYGSESMPRVSDLTKFGLPAPSVLV